MLQSALHCPMGTLRERIDVDGQMLDWVPGKREESELALPQV